MFGMSTTGWTVLLMGLALSMDALSLGVALGAEGIRRRDSVRLAVMIGYFHILLPLLSILIGDWLSTLFGEVFSRLAAFFMMILGAKMAIEALRQTTPKRSRKPLVTDWWHITGMGLAVSIDALAVGFSLGAIDVKPLYAAITFGVVSSSFAFMGMMIGRRVHRQLGHHGQLIGGMILLMLGLKFLF
nr:manganese efflux pump [Bacilli bacterium]